MAGLLELELEIDDLSITLPSHTLDLSRKGITQLPYEIPGSYILEVNLFIINHQSIMLKKLIEFIFRGQSIDSTARLPVFMLS